MSAKKFRDYIIYGWYTSIEWFLVFQVTSENSKQQQFKWNLILFNTSIYKNDIWK